VTQCCIRSGCIECPIVASDATAQTGCRAASAPQRVAAPAVRVGLPLINRWHSTGWNTAGYQLRGRPVRPADRRPARPREGVNDAGQLPGPPTHQQADRAGTRRRHRPGAGVNIAITATGCRSVAPGARLRAAVGLAGISMAWDISACQCSTVRRGSSCASWVTPGRGAPARSAWRPSQRR